LIVRNMDKDVVRALKQPAASNGRSVETAHREILKAALLQPPRRSFANVVANMPNCGEDANAAKLSVPLRRSRPMAATTAGAT
jgi:plasmid stability protein